MHPLRLSVYERHRRITADKILRRVTGFWSMHWSSSTPCRCVLAPYVMARSKLIVAFQTLHVYDRAGKLVKDAGQTTPKRVVEHLVFEKRLWYNMPWMIKDRIFDQ